MTEPGWYADPAAPTVLFRWWDGQSWTEALSETRAAPAPPSAPAIRPTTGRPRRARRSPFRIVVAAAAGLALFVAASAGAASLIWGDPPTRVSDPPSSAPVPSATTLTPTPATPLGRLDTATRVATIGSADLNLPDDPFVLYPDPLTVNEVFNQLFWTSTTVHPSYDGRRDWSATVFFGQLSDPLNPVDLQAQGRLTARQLSRTLYDRHGTKVTDLALSDHPVDGRPGMLVTAKVRYQVTHLPSRYDNLRAVIVRLDDGSVVLAGASVPNDTDPTTAAQANAALDTLHIS